MKLLNNNWVLSHFQDDNDTLEKITKQAKACPDFLKLLSLYIDHELASLDSQCSISALKSVPDKGEYLLLLAGKRDTLYNLKSLLLDDL